MTVKELIEALQSIEDKNQRVWVTYMNHCADEGDYEVETGIREVHQRPGSGLMPHYIELKTGY